MVEPALQVAEPRRVDRQHELAAARRTTVLVVVACRLKAEALADISPAASSSTIMAMAEPLSQLARSTGLERQPKKTFHRSENPFSVKHGLAPAGVATVDACKVSEIATHLPVGLQLGPKLEPQIFH